ncbi:MAG: UDP-N-acetylmuramoyl-L-alanine--D-glutamate ligase [Gemmatimonadota bacterium]|nr:MAG: UDP-N-acetylmuramoyl-L-alanine--D-glutamate ligase [Gemmatimonadota bacterium]
MVRLAWSELRVGVLGLGRSGRAAARLLRRAGASVYASDAADSGELRSAARELRSEGVNVDLGRHDRSALADCDLLVASPGIPPTAEVFGWPEVKSLRVISELELAFAFLAAPIIAVTGTNGKTTTTAWIGEVLRRGGVRVGVGGNIGRALSELAADREAGYEWVVAEVSSFQLAQIERFNPAIGVLLNLCPDHLDRYEDVNLYYADKARLFANASPESRWVLNGEDLEVRRMAEGRLGRATCFWVATPPTGDEDAAFLARGRILVARMEGREIELLARDELKLLGTHNVANALAAALVALYVRVPLEAIREGLREFEPLPHRLQPVAEYGGVLWINDSKATNVASTRVALQAMDRPVVLLLGGRPKGQSFAGLTGDLTGRVKAVVAYGEAGEQIEEELGKRVRVVRVEGSLEDVVDCAARLTEPGDAVLLAPACASFDMFHDYEERGSVFTRLVSEAAA